ncbi:MAG: hypothetical protein H8Z69_01215 [Nanohaloarchaea archaeon]|nr:hypothetical protein [Candidatus Nanohaloarchaea archaeon]
MKKQILIALITVALLASAGAVVREDGTSPSNNPGEGQMGITSGGAAASATTSVGPNGTRYSVSVTPINQSSNVTEDKVLEVSEFPQGVRFNGLVKSPTPCHTLNHDVEKNGSKIDLRIYMESSNQTCTQQMVMKKYHAEVESENYFELDIYHGDSNKTMETVTYGEKQDETDEETEEDVGLLGWILGVFL